jgi:hypothetical protein
LGFVSFVLGIPLIPSTKVLTKQQAHQFLERFGEKTPNGRWEANIDAFEFEFDGFMRQMATEMMEELVTSDGWEQERALHGQAESWGW